jgi:hypothetical protein
MAPVGIERRVDHGHWLDSLLRWLGQHGRWQQRVATSESIDAVRYVTEEQRQSIWPKPPRGFPSWGYYFLRVAVAFMFCYWALLATSLTGAVYAFRRGATVVGSVYVVLFVIELLFPFAYRRYKAQRRKKAHVKGTWYGDPVVGADQPVRPSETAPAYRRSGGTWVVR